MLGSKQLCIFAGTLVSLFVLGGCAHTYEYNGMSVDQVPNPTAGPTVTITKVTDMRKFETDPKNDDTPRLRESKDIGNRAVTSRAFGYGRLGADSLYFVMTDQTVEGLVQTAVENALRDRGYSVVANNSPAAANAVPVEVEIRKFWFVLSQGFWTIGLGTDVEVEIKSRLAIDASGTESVVGHYANSVPYFHYAMVRSNPYAAIKDMCDNLKPKLKPAK